MNGHWSSSTSAATASTYLFEFLIVTGSFACALAFHNAASRYIYAIGREIPAPRTRSAPTHQRARSPHIASVDPVGDHALLIAFFCSPGPSWATTSCTGGLHLRVRRCSRVLGTMAILLVQALCSVAVIWYFQVKKVHPGNSVTTGVIPALGATRHALRRATCCSATCPSPAARRRVAALQADALHRRCDVPAGRARCMLWLRGAIRSSLPADRAHRAGGRPRAGLTGRVTSPAPRRAAPTRGDPRSRTRIRPLTYTFGGVEPVASARARHRALDLDAGLLRRPGALGRRPGQRGLRPARTSTRRPGPFFVEGAEPGDTAGGALRVDRAARGVGGQHDGPAVRLADRDADDRDAARAAARADLVSTSSTSTSGWSATRRWTRAFTARPAARPDARDGRGRAGARARCARRWPPATGAATWTPRRCAPASPATSA